MRLSVIISPFHICGKGMFQFQRAVNRGPIALCKIPHISMHNFPASNATNRYYRFDQYLCTPGWWKPILPSCQSFSHSSSFFTRSAGGACILLVCQRLGENKTHIQQRDWELGVDNRSEGTHITLWHSWQALYRQSNGNINLDLREVNVGEISTRVKAKFNWVMTQQLSVRMIRSNRSFQVARQVTKYFSSQIGKTKKRKRKKNFY